MGSGGGLTASEVDLGKFERLPEEGVSLVTEFSRSSEEIFVI